MENRIYNENTELIVKLQAFMTRLNSEPNQKEFDTTPDGKAKTLPISFVEMTLDELYHGRWGSRNFTSKVILNEVIGELELYVIHPITGEEITRIGAASIIIQVDRKPEGISGKEANQWSLDPSNKKSNALDLGYPKLKAECIKNAAQSLGKLLGRDINRKNKDVYKTPLKPIPDNAFKTLLERVEKGEHQLVLVAEQNFIIDELQMAILQGAAQKMLS